MLDTTNEEGKLFGFTRLSVDEGHEVFYQKTESELTQPEINQLMATLIKAWNNNTEANRYRFRLLIEERCKEALAHITKNLN